MIHSCHRRGPNLFFSPLSNLCKLFFTHSRPRQNSQTFLASSLFGILWLLSSWTLPTPKGCLLPLSSSDANTEKFLAELALRRTLHLNHLPFIFSYHPLRLVILCSVAQSCYAWCSDYKVAGIWVTMKLWHFWSCQWQLLAIRKAVLST